MVADIQEDQFHHRENKTVRTASFLGLCVFSIQLHPQDVSDDMHFHVMSSFHTLQPSKRCGKGPNLDNNIDRDIMMASAHNPPRTPSAKLDVGPFECDHP
jgi:hypothetical protein